MIIALCEPNRGVYTETFIRAHAEQLPGPVLHLSGGHPLWSFEDRKIIPAPYRAAEFVGKRLSGNMLGAIRRACSRELTSFFRTRRVDVVLAEYGSTAVELRDACRAAHLPLVAHFHGADAYQHRMLEEHRETYPAMFREAAAIVGVSRAMVQQLLRLGAPPEKVFYNPCGVDPKAFPPTDPGANEPLFVAVGRFVDKKAPHLTLLAFAHALRKAPAARLVMIGDGPLWSACRVMADALQLGDRVLLTGRQSPRQVAEWLAKARALVQHSLVPPAGESEGDSEGTPLAVLEAGACALPVIATRHAGVPDVVAAGVTGMLCEEKDTVAMGDAIAALAQDPALAVRLGAEGRRRVLAAFSRDFCIGRLHRILESAAAGTVTELWKSGAIE